MPTRQAPERLAASDRLLHTGAGLEALVEALLQRLHTFVQ